MGLTSGPFHPAPLQQHIASVHDGLEIMIRLLTLPLLSPILSGFGLLTAEALWCTGQHSPTTATLDDEWNNHPPSPVMVGNGTYALWLCIRWEEVRMDKGNGGYPDMPLNVPLSSITISLTAKAWSSASPREVGSINLTCCRRGMGSKP